jgi:hypothetical protein
MPEGSKLVLNEVKDLVSFSGRSFEAQDARGAPLELLNFGTPALAAFSSRAPPVPGRLNGALLFL